MRYNGGDVRGYEAWVSGLDDEGLIQETASRREIAEAVSRTAHDDGTEAEKRNVLQAEASNRGKSWLFSTGMSQGVAEKPGEGKDAGL